MKASNGQRPRGICSKQSGYSRPRDGSNRSRAAFAFMISAFFSIVAYAQSADWQLYTFVEDGFSVSFPAKPAFQQRTVSFPAGTLEFHFHILTWPSGALIASVHDLPKTSEPIDARRVLQDGVDGSVKSSNSRLLRQSKIVMAGIPGVEYEAENATMHFVTRSILVGSKAYSVLVTSPVATPYAETKRFLDSFQLLPTVDR